MARLPDWPATPVRSKQLTEFEFQLLPGRNPGPLLEERAAESANTQNLRFREDAWRKLVELFGRPERPGTTLGIEEANDSLHFAGFRGQRP